MARPRPGKKVSEAVSLVLAKSPGHKIDPESFKMLLEALASGASLITASACCGVSHKTTYRWLKQGEDDPENSPYRDVARLMRAAMAKPKIEAYVRLQRAGKMDWRAAESFLKHRAQDEFHVAKAIEVTGANGGPIQHEVAVIALEKLEARLDGLSDEELEELAEGEE